MRRSRAASPACAIPRAPCASTRSPRRPPASAAAGKCATGPRAAARKAAGSPPPPRRGSIGGGARPRRRVGRPRGGRMSLELTEEERAYLATLLDQTWRGLKEEIHRTEDTDYKAELRADEQLLLGLLHRVRRLGSLPPALRPGPVQLEAQRPGDPVRVAGGGRGHL